jgi:hypothetical protein
MDNLGANVAKVVLPMGLNATDLGPFIGALTSQNSTALFMIPGVTPQMAASAGHQVLETYATAFRSVWIAAACFVGVATICELLLPVPSCHVFTLL